MPKSNALTFFLSFVPGVGHYYLELMQRGLQFNLAFFGLIVMLVVTGIGILGVFLPVIWFYSLFDALQMAAKINSDGIVADQPIVPWRKLPLRAPAIGWILILLGLYSFFTVNRFIDWTRFFPRGFHFDNTFISLVLVGFGVHLLLGRRRPDQTQGDDAS